MAIEFTFDSSGHEAYLAIYEGTEFFSKIKLRLTRASLTPVYPRYRELHAALRNMSGREVDDEWDPFVGRTASWEVSSGGQEGGNSEFYLELVYENRSMERDAAWLMTLVSSDDPFRHASLQVTHAPFSVSRFDKPRMDPEGGEMFAQWLSNDPEGAQWRFAVETVTMQLPPQAIGETMERGARLWGAQRVTPIDDTKPVLQRFSRCTQLTVKPSRLPRRYTVHPGDLLTTLKDAQLERLTVEVGYPLELTYARTERATRTVVISEVGGSLGRPAISLAPDLQARSDVPDVSAIR